MPTRMKGSAAVLMALALIAFAPKPVRADVPVEHIAVHAGVYPHGLNARQFRYMVKYGLTPLQAIQAATIRAAELMRTENEVGSITVGKFADLVAVAADPLDHIETLEDVKAVIKGGVLVP